MLIGDARKYRRCSSGEKTTPIFWLVLAAYSKSQCWFVLTDDYLSLLAILPERSYINCFLSCNRFRRAELGVQLVAKTNPLLKA